MLEHSFYLSSFDSGEPLEKIVDSSPILGVLEERFDRNASACKRPCSTHSVGYPLNRVARIPIKHQSNGIADFPLGPAPTRAKWRRVMPFTRSIPLRRVVNFFLKSTRVLGTSVKSIHRDPVRMNRCAVSRVVRLEESTHPIFEFVGRHAVAGRIMVFPYRAILRDSLS